MSFTVEEVKKAIEEFESSDAYEQTYSYSEPSMLDDLMNEEEQSFDVPGLGKVEFVENFGGEGQGDDYWLIFKVGEQYFQQDGYYASHDGGYLDGDLYEVEPVKVTKTEYKVKK